MGQVASTSRDQRQDGRPSSYLSSQHQNGDSDTTTNNIVMPDQPGRRGSFSHAQSGYDNPDLQPQISLPPIASQPDQTDGEDLPRRGTYTSLPSISQLFNSHSSRPGEQNATSAPISQIGPRRQSTMSRLGSRILPNAVIRGLLSSEEETAAEGRAHRSGRLSRSLRRTETTANNRFSPFNSLGSRSSTRRRSIRGSVNLSTPPRSDPALIVPPAMRHTTSSVSPSTRNSNPQYQTSDLYPARNSLPFPSPPALEPNNQEETSPNLDTMSSDSSRSLTFGQPADSLLPPLNPVDTYMDLGEASHAAASLDPDQTTAWPTSSVPSPARTPPELRTIRRLPGVLRARSSRVLRRDEQTPLSRVLQLAAAAIAAQLAGSEGLGLLNPPSAGNSNNDGLGASLETFIHSLQQATSGQNTLSSTGDNERPSTDSQQQPVNFLRVFRFANPSGQSSPPSSSIPREHNTSDRMSVEGQGEDGIEERTVTLVVVGVRSVPSTTNNIISGRNTAPLGLDGFLGLPVNPPGHATDASSNADFLRRHDGRSRLATQRASVGAAIPLASAPDGQRPLRLSPVSEPRSEPSLPPSGIPSTLPTVLLESPPGPYPPPSTPAVSSGTNTPSRRPSSSSAIHPGGLLPQLNEDPSSAIDPMETEPSFASARQRRRSESEAARHRHLGSGAARRNGVVEPDNPGTPVGRTWLIYVVGTNLSENHPAFATPSLFTDNPTYEDMILLSSLLGPVKPPVASEADIRSAGGLFRLSEYAGSLVAEPLDGSPPIQLGEGERCLICLSDYEAAEEVRQLNRCQHLFHKLCIDQWLTTGRNSCPLCRGQGVFESSRTSNPPSAEESAV